MDNRKVISGLFFINFAITLGFGIADAFFSVYSQSLGIRGVSLGLAVAAYACSKIIFSPLLGMWSDRINQKTIICTSLFISLAVSFGYLLFADIFSLVVLRMLQGVGFAIFRPTLLSLLKDFAPPDRRATTTGTFDISFYGALAVGPILGGLLNDSFGFSGVYCALFGFCVIAFMVALACIPSTMKSDRPELSESASNSLRSLLDDVKSGGALTGLLAFIFGRACSISVLVTFLPVMILIELGMSSTLLGLIMASSTVVMAILLRPMGKLADKTSREQLVIAGGVGVSLLYLLIPFTVSIYEFLMLGAGIGLFSALSQPASMSLLMEQGNNIGMGLKAGALNSSLNLGFITGPMLGSLLYSERGIESVFYFSGICGLVSVCLFLTCTMSRYRIISRTRL